MQGYFKNPTATAETIDADGWLHTGDIGHYDERGFFKIVDRTKELIKVKGLQVSFRRRVCLLFYYFLFPGSFPPFLYSSAFFFIPFFFHSPISLGVFYYSFSFSHLYSLAFFFSFLFHSFFSFSSPAFHGVFLLFHLTPFFLSLT